MVCRSPLVDFPHVRKPRGEARRTNGSTLNHVADGESLDRLVLWCTPRTVGAADGLDVTSSLLVATAVVDMLVAELGIPDFRVGGVLGCSFFDHVCGSRELVRQ